MIIHIHLALPVWHTYYANRMLKANFPGLVFSTWPVEKCKRMDIADPFKKTVAQK